MSSPPDAAQKGFNTVTDLALKIKEALDLSYQSNAAVDHLREESIFYLDAIAELGNVHGHKELGNVHDHKAALHGENSDDDETNEKRDDHHKLVAAEVAKMQHLLHDIFNWTNQVRAEQPPRWCTIICSKPFEALRSFVCCKKQFEKGDMVEVKREEDDGRLGIISDCAEASRGLYTIQYFPPLPPPEHPERVYVEMLRKVFIDPNLKKGERVSIWVEKEKKWKSGYKINKVVENEGCFIVDGLTGRVKKPYSQVQLDRTYTEGTEVIVNTKVGKIAEVTETGYQIKYDDENLQTKRENINFDDSRQIRKAPPTFWQKLFEKTNQCPGRVADGCLNAKARMQMAKDYVLQLKELTEKINLALLIEAHKTNELSQKKLVKLDKSSQETEEKIVEIRSNQRGLGLYSVWSDASSVAAYIIPGDSPRKDPTNEKTKTDGDEMPWPASIICGMTAPTTGPGLPL